MLHAPGIGSRTLKVVLAIAATVCLGGCAFVGAWYDFPPRTHSFDRVERMRVAMRDGKTLTTDVYFPSGAGPWPVILVRNPYNQHNIFAPIGKLFAGYGYAVVHQDVRGRYASEGEWVPLLNEHDDGRDTLAWLVKQPWQDGNIALFGASYLSAVQWAVADALPPQVKTMVPMIIGTDLRNVLYEKGMFRHEVFSFWALLMPGNEMAVFNGLAYQKAVRHWPPVEADEIYIGRRLDWYREWLASPGADAPIWQRDDARLLQHLPEQTTIPVLMVTGWYDIFVESQISDFNRLGSRARSRLIVGPWTHLLGLLGDGVKPMPEAGNLLDQFGRIINWLDHHLKGAPLADWGPVETYAIGQGRWYRRPEWPGTTATLKLYPRVLDRSWSCSGGGLATRAGRAVETAHWIYDPRNPVPTLGGDAMLAFVMPGWQGAPPSIRDQDDLCERDDVLTFISDPLRRPMHIAGGVKVYYTVSSDAPDTAFTAKLIEVGADGKAVNIRDSITSLKYRNDSPTALPYVPGSRVDVRLDLWPIEWELPAGARLRLDVSSSNFPAYHAHGNTDDPWAEVRQPRIAHQTLYAGGDSATRIEIPVIEPGP